MPKAAATLSAFRHAAAASRRGGRFHLSRIDPAATPFASGDKMADKARVETLAQEIGTLQNLFHADGRYKLLVLLQGVDTSGKDGTIRAVFGRCSPQGVRCVPFDVPSPDEQAHDFLWRIHRQVPALGETAIFNRSHYEDVIVPVVQRRLTTSALRQRYAQINGFERLLAETGTVICKFMLHISKEEQRERLQKRLDDPQKRWKFSAADIAARRHWRRYQAAYHDAIAATGTRWAPWIVVPADSKTHRNLMVGEALKQLLRRLKLRYPAAAELPAQID